MRRFLLGALVSGIMLVSWQVIPPYIPDDGDDSGGIHEGQPMYCVNYDGIEGSKNCECKKKCDRDAPEDSKCKVYCRKTACRCNHGCHS